MKANNTYIIGANTVLGKKITNGVDVPLGNSNVYDKMGIKNIREFDEAQEDVYELLVHLIIDLLAEYNLEKEDIDGIISSSTGTLDVIPGLSHELGSRLGLTSDKTRMNVGSACSGALHALYIAQEEMNKKKIATGNEQIFIVVAADYWSKTKDNDTMPMVSDSAGIFIVSTTPLGNKAYKIDNIEINHEEVSPEDLRAIEHKQGGLLTMPKGGAVYKFAVSKGEELFRTLTQGHTGPIVYIPHNANSKIIQSISDKLKDVQSLSVYGDSIKDGNLGGVSVIDGLKNVLERDSPDKIVLGAFGGNLESVGVSLSKHKEGGEKEYIVPDTSQYALLHNKVWNLDNIVVGKSSTYEELYHLRDYEYISPNFEITSDLVHLFNAITGDSNPHYNEDYAQKTQIGKRPVPGLLQSSLIGNTGVIHKALSVEGCNHIVRDMSIKYNKPIFIGEKISYKMRVIKSIRGFVMREYDVIVGDEVRSQGTWTSVFQKL